MIEVTLGLRIRQIRRQRKLSLEALAAKSGLTKSYLSKLERGINSPSIATTLKIARAFGVELGQLLGETTDKDGFCLIRKKERKPLVRRGTQYGYYYESIAYKRRSKCMEAFVVRPPKRYEDNKTFFEHPGEEMMFVLNGQVEVIVADKRAVLAPGDSVYFDAHMPHRTRSVGRTQAETLVVVGGM